MTRLRYKHKDHIMTDTEHTFFKLLIETVGDKYYVFPQIHLGTIVRPNMPSTYRWLLWRKAFFFSDRYSVDYILCDKDESLPTIAIELDDKSHQREKRKYRDRIVEKILRESNLRLERFTIAESLDRNIIESRIAKLS